MTYKKSIVGGLIGLFLVGAVSMFGYTSGDSIANAQDGGTPPPAMPVTVEVVRSEPIQLWQSFSAHMAAVDYAEIKPQVSGTITEVRFEDGAHVEAGDILFVIDPRPYKAAVNFAQAELSAAQNRAYLAEKEKNRAADLVETDAISRRVYDERVSASKVADADVQRARAQVDQAKINLDYAYVKAPISGKASRAELKVGNRVDAGPQAPVLTSIVSSDGIYADFEIDEQTYLKYVRNSRTQDTDTGEAQSAPIPVKISLDQDNVSYEGVIHSFDNRIDTGSGTIRARAYLDNKDGSLLPGMFAKVYVGQTTPSEKIVVAERAIGTDQDRKFVYVIDDKNTAAYRPVTIGDSVNGKRVVTSGLEVGDQVITEGIIRIRPGMPVAAQEPESSEVIVIEGDAVKQQQQEEPGEQALDQQAQTAEE